MSDIFSNDWPVESDWQTTLGEWILSPEMKTLQDWISQQRESNIVYPEPGKVFTAFRLTSFQNTRVVILGQDPYHGPGQAHGLAFSVLDDIKLPPSLRNIFKELESDLEVSPPVSGNLEAWARQGVLLLNTVLTVEAGKAGSHRKRGWEQFTDQVICCLNDHPNDLVFVLWGKPAQQKAKLIDERHTRIESPHPSPLSAYRGFFDSKPFSQINEMLKAEGGKPVNWCLNTESTSVSSTF